MEELPRGSRQKGYSLRGRRMKVAKPTRPPPSKTRRPGSGITEDCATAGAAKEFVASIRTSREPDQKFRNVMTPFTLDSRKMFSNSSAFTINFTEPFFPGQIMS